MSEAPLSMLIFEPFEAPPLKHKPAEDRHGGNADYDDVVKALGHGSVVGL
jgi:hypothetical protein